MTFQRKTNYLQYGCVNIVVKQLRTSLVIEQSTILLELRELAEGQKLTSVESVAMQIQNKESGTSILMYMIEDLKRDQHETAAETLKHNQKLIEENENLRKRLQCESETVNETLNMNQKLMDENDDIKKHIEDITQHWAVKQNGNSIQQLLREMKDIDFSITSENVLHIKNTPVAVGDIKSNS